MWLTLKQHGFEYVIFSINTVKVFSLSYDFLNNTFFSLDYYTIRIQYIIHITYQLHLNQLFILSVKLLVNSRLSIVFREPKVIPGFSTK